MKLFFLLLCCLWATVVTGQQVERLYFRLYTDSLKRGSWNYINVEGRLSNGKVVPLSAPALVLTSSAGRVEGNSIWLAWDHAPDSLKVVAFLRQQPGLRDSMVLHLQKVDFQLGAPTQDSLLQELNRRNRVPANKKRKQ